MLIQELKNQLNTGKSLDELIDFKLYLPIVEKKLIANKIIDSCIIVDDAGLNRIDYFYKYLTTNVLLLVNYTSLEFSDELINDYDYLNENIGVEWILNKIPVSEKNFIFDLVEDELYQMLKFSNSLENILSQKLQQLIDKIPNDKQLKSLSKSLIKDINKLDWDKVPMLKQMWLTANGKSGEKVG